jgi:flagellar motor switch/type III secretory pathway protein FliN
MTDPLIRPFRPFPWSALSSTTRADEEALAALRRGGRDGALFADVARAIGAATGARVGAFIRRVGGRMADGVAARFDAGGAPWVIAAEPALAGALVARVLKRAAPALVEASHPVGDALAGAFAAVLAAAARKATTAAPRLLACGAAPALAADLTRSHGDLVVASVTVVVEDNAYAAQIACPRDALLFARGDRARWSRTGLKALGSARIALPVVACATAATRTDVAALAPGDAWMPGAWPLKNGPAMTGPVLLAAPRSDRAIRADLGEDGRLVLRDGSEDLRMDESLVDALGDVPVIVRVEIGAAEMSAREWAALGEGDVVALGRKVAEPVVLRVGGAEVARGELVEIEGEVGVRILSLRDGGAAA